MSERCEITGFALPEDGWYNIAVPGEWPHKPTGLIQVIDDDSLQSLVTDFEEKSRQPNWPGVLIDFDHQSLDQDKPTVAAGWITTLEKRPNGVWAQIKWSDLGKKSIEGGRYRFISPVWRSSDCAMLGQDRIRPLRLMNCAVTNDPNIKGMFPLSNTANAEPEFAPPAIPIVAEPIVLKNASGKPMSDDERKAFFAKMSGGGGGGGYGGGGSSGGGGSGGATASTAPAQAPNPHRVRAEALKAEKEALLATVGERPAGGTSQYATVNPREYAMQVFRETGDTKAFIDAKKEANERNKAARDAYRRHYKQITANWKTQSGKDRAWQNYLKKIDAAEEREMRDWQKNYDRVAREVAAIDTKIETAEAQAERLEWTDQQEAEKQFRAESARQAKLDLERAAQELKEKESAERAANRAEAEKLAAARREVAKPHMFWALVEHGTQDSKDRALELYPNANWPQAVKDYKTFKEVENIEGRTGSYAREKLKAFTAYPPAPINYYAGP